MKNLGNLTDNEIYKLWLSSVKDRRYLRRKRWDELKKAILANKVKTVIEFGSGISTILMSNMGLDVLSLETDKRHLLFVKNLCPKATFRPWNNDGSLKPSRTFDLAFIDGILPRIPQLEVAKRCSNIIAIDDFVGKLQNQCLPLLDGYKKINPDGTMLAIFKTI